MKIGHLLRYGASVPAAALLLAGCSSSSYEYPDAHLVPEKPGLYAVRNDELKRLDGDREWENETWKWRSDLPSNVEFVVYDPSIKRDDTSADDTVNLYRVGWLRSEIGADGSIQPIVKGSRWVVPEADVTRVPLAIDHVAGREDVIRATPRESLSEGLYSLQIRSDRVSKNARVGVDWPALNHDDYAASHCFDRYRGMGEGQLRPCGRQHELLLGRDLQLHLVKPYRQTVNGVDQMVIQGVLANSGKQPRRVPPLTAELKDDTGQIIKSWRFVPEADQLAPGESVSFETVVNAPPSGTKTVTVNLGRTMTSEM